MTEHSETGTEKPSSSEPTAPEPKPAPVEPPQVYGMPADMFVRGGTTSWKHDQAQAQLTFESEARRNTQDRERAIAATPLDQGGGKLYGGPLTPHKDVEQGLVELFYVNSKGEKMFELGEAVRCLADIMIINQETMELAIILVCMNCKKNGVPQDRCQMRVMQSNKRWELSTKRAGDMIPWKEPVLNPVTGEIDMVTRLYRSAGTIVETEKFRCYQCNWEARISDNRVRSS